MAKSGAISVKKKIVYKNASNTWTLVGGEAWKNSWPTVQGSNAVTSTLVPGNIITINGINVTVPNAPNNTLAGLVAVVNAAAITGVTAAATSNRFELYADTESQGVGSDLTAGSVSVEGTSGLLTSLGVAAGDYFVPELQISPNFTVPRWRSTDTQPRPTGSVWFQTTAVNQGADFVIRRYDATVGAFVTESVPVYANQADANFASGWWS